MKSPERYATKITTVQGFPTPQEMGEWLLRHPIMVVAFTVGCVGISLTLISRIWSIHQGDSMAKKTIWSVILFIPFAGWLFYGGFYHPVGYNDNRPPPRND